MDVITSFVGWIEKVLGWGDIAVIEGRNYSGWLFMALFLLALAKVFNLKVKIGGR